MSREFTAELFMDGEHQAVRLPDECRLDATEVWIWREGSRVIIEPVTTEKREWPEGYWERLRSLSVDADLEVPEPLPPAPHRDAVLDELNEP